MRSLLSCLLAVAAALAVLYGCTRPADETSSASVAIAASEPAPATSLQLQKVVMLMRHGVRPPTKPYVIPRGYASQAWPKWDVPPGHLTRHGYDGAVLLGRWNRKMLSKRGLLPADGCPADGRVRIHADTDQRTRRTGVGFAEGFAPDCTIEITHTGGDRDDPLFAPIANGAVSYDPEKAKALILARADHDLGSFDAAALDKAFQRLDAILDCCSLPLCKASGLPEGCQLSQIHYVWEELREDDHVDFVGPLSVGGTASESILLEYANGMPMAQVGWGRVQRSDLRLLSRIHAAEFDLLSRTPYAASHGATPIMKYVLQALDDPDGPSLAVLVGHDTNVANVGGMLDLHWQVPGYARDDAAINGALGFELLTDAEGGRHVRAFYLAQGLDQLRELQPLDAEHPPYFEYLAQPTCAASPDGTDCTLTDFEQSVRAHLVE